jgi:hypothetical protein
MKLHEGKSGHVLRHAYGVAVALLALGVGSVATESVARAEPGEHIRAGEAVITPKISVGLEQNTNVYRAESATMGGTNLRVAPGLEIGAEGPELDFTFHGEYELYTFLQPQLANLNRFNDFSVGANVNALKESKVGFRLKDEVGLRNYPAESEFAQRPYETQFRNVLEGGVVARPGTALEFIGTGNWTFEDYQVTSAGQLTGERSFNRKSGFGPALQVNYKFFPRTMFRLDVMYQMNRWEDNLIEAIATDGSGDIGAELAVPDSNMLRIMAGMNGRISERLVLAAMAGYGSGSFLEESVGVPCTDVDCGQDIEGLGHLLVDTQFRYEPSKDDRFVLGYQRNFRDVFFTNFVQYDYGFGRLETRLSKHFGLTGELGGRSEGYRGEIARNDLFLVGKGDVAYYTRNDWLSFQSGLWWTQRASDDDDVEYDNFNIHLLANITY